MAVDLNNLSFEEGLSELGISLDDLINNLPHMKSQREALVPNIPGEQILLDAALKQYLDSISGKQKLTIVTYSCVLKEFLCYMKECWEQKDITDNSITSVTRTDIEIFLNSIKPKKKSKSYSPCSYNKKLSILNAFFKGYLVEEKGLLENAPTKGIRRKKEGEGHVRFLTKIEQEKVLKKALENKESGKRDFVIIYLALNTGIRLDEISQLNVNDIDIRHDRIYIQRGKGGKYREAFMTNEVKTILTNYMKNIRLGGPKGTTEEPLFLKQKGGKINERLSKSAVEAMVVRVFRKCGINNGAMHRTRHSFAVNALDSGINIVEIMMLLGHENISTTVKYLRLDNERILKKVKENFPLAFLSINDIPEISKIVGGID